MIIAVARPSRRSAFVRHGVGRVASSSKIMAVAALAVCLSGCALRGPAGDRQFASAAPVQLAPPSGPHQIGISDVLRIRVLGEPELSNDATTVSQAGTIDMLLLGEVEAVGITTAELADLLRARLDARYLVDPKVSVSLVSSARHHVIVEGEVNKPGVFALSGDMSLLQAIALAEGPTEVARLKDVLVIREEAGRRLAARFNLKSIRSGESEDPYLLPRDTVIVGQSFGSLIYRDLAKSLPSLTSMFVVIGRE
jgi:polysaccharide biosynthesis/export protein